jgi:uncharacterized protein (TIGR02453 family)
VAFTGWPAEAIEFYEGLEADNTKSYWLAHKTVYEDLVRQPMLELLAELEPEFGDGKIFRPYNDVRFRKDKSPYKTSIGATVGDGGFVRLSVSGLSAGRGMFHLGPGQLDRFRRAIAADPSGTKLAAIVAEVRQAGLDIAAHDRLKTAPQGYPKDHPRAELLRYKGLIAWQEWPAGEWLGTPEAKSRVVGFLRAAAPLADWLATHVGPEEED